MLAFEDFLHPQLSASAQAFIRTAYGILLAGTLVMALPQWRRFFVSERWGGYAQSSRDVDALHNRVVYPLIAALWLACAVLIACGRWSVWAALVNLILCRYFFVRMRWKGVLRGMGAPGFMTYWLAAAVFLLEYTLHYAPHLQPVALLVLQVDFALIILSAGIYKWTAGYPRNHGMEMGLVNPQWGYWWRSYLRLPPSHWLFKTLNHLAWTTEVAAVLLMLIPATRFLGGLLIIISFAFIATQIRLGFLCEMVMVCGLLFFGPGSAGDHWLALIISPAASPVTTADGLWPAVNMILAAALWGYLLLLPFAHAGLFYNFYARRRLPLTLQKILEAYTNFFGIIIWRVFSVDVVNFFIRIYRRERAGGERALVSHYGLKPPGLRYNHVGESITVTSLFTTLKYHPSNSALFTERLLRYARTIACPAGSVLDFEYLSICKTDDRFEFVAVAEYTVDPAAGTVDERILSDAVSVRAAHAASPVFEGARPGSYAPLKG
jgi:hypothetical protein